MEIVGNSSAKEIEFLIKPTPLEEAVPKHAGNWMVEEPEDDSKYQPWFSPHDPDFPKPGDRMVFTRRQAWQEHGCCKYFPDPVKRALTQAHNAFHFLFSLVYCYSFIIAGLTVTTTVLCFEVGWSSGSLPWSIVSVACIFPITLAISNSVSRRDMALRNFAQLRSAAFGIFLGFKSWGPRNRKDRRTVFAVLGRDLLYTYLDHVVEFFDGADNTDTAKLPQLYTDITNIGEAAENLRLNINGDKEAIPAGTVHRVQQYVFHMQCCFEKMKSLKQYRTPPPLRAFSYLTILTFPFVYGIYFAAVAEGTNIAFAIFAGILVSLVMTGLQNVSDHVECLFDHHDKRNEYIDIAYPIAQLKASMRVQGDPPLHAE